MDLGFLLMADPEPKPRPDTPPPAAVAVEVPTARKVERPTATVPPPPPPTPPPPQPFRLKGGSGTVWEHPDPAYLRWYVATQDAPKPVVVEMRGTAVRYSYGSSCANGRCSRR